MATKEIEKYRGQLITLSIAEAHIQRLGPLRALLGGFNMYWSIPIWVILHLTTATFFYQKIICPLFRLPPVNWKNHVILDRHLIDGLRPMDKLNCLFCAYANGLTTMINKEIDNLANFSGKLSFGKSFILAIATLFFIPIILLCELIGIQIIYNILVAPPLGLHRYSFYEIDAQLKKSPYAGHFSSSARSLILFAKNSFLRFSLLLEQIESSWCPLKHLDQRAEVVHPDHHRNFFRPDELNQMREVLMRKGTVSPKLPLY